MYLLERTQRLPITIDEAWQFFASPSNLKTITPAYMGFHVLTGGNAEMYAGMIITYRLTPLFNIPLTWVTEITHVQDKKLFVDEQRVGPYTIWHHQHHFKSIEHGIEMTDILHYKLPFGILGNLIHILLVKRKINKIFEFRKKKLEELFGVYSV